MPGDVSRPDPDIESDRAKTMKCLGGECEKHRPRPGTTSRIGRTTGLRIGSGSVFLSTMISLSVFAIPNATSAQNKKAGSESPTKEKASTAPKDLYGDQGGEKVAEANPRLPNTVLRARLEDTFLKLSDPRLRQADGPGSKPSALLVDYVVTSLGKFDGGFLVLHTDDGDRAEIALKSIVGRDHGTIELVGVQFFGNLKFFKNATFPKNVEMYVTRGDDRYDPPSRFMVSNSVVMGKMKTTTRPRDWTAQEIDTPSRRPAIRTQTPTPILAWMYHPSPHTGANPEPVRRAGRPPARSRFLRGGLCWAESHLAVDAGL